MPQQIAGSTPPTKTSFVTPNHPEWSRLNFPHRLHHLLTSMEVAGLGHIAHWDDHGLCFKIRKSDELIQNFLPFFFQQRKWKSFQRQMNIYSFKRIPDGINKGYYCHPYFQRSDISMARKILRKKQKSELSSESLIQSSQDYSCHHPMLVPSLEEPPLLCGFSPRRQQSCLSGRATTTLGFSLNSHFDDDDHHSDTLLGYHHLSSTFQGCPGISMVMDHHDSPPSSSSSSFFKRTEGASVRPLVLVSVSSDSEDTSGSGFSCYNRNVTSGIYGESVMMDDPPASIVFRRVGQDKGVEASYFDLSSENRDEDFLEGATNHHPSSSGYLHSISENHVDWRSVMMIHKHQRARSGGVLEEQQEADDSPLDDESITTIDDLTGLMILDIEVNVKDHVHQSNNHIGDPPAANYRVVQEPTVHTRYNSITLT